MLPTDGDGRGSNTMSLQAPSLLWVSLLACGIGSAKCSKVQGHAVVCEHAGELKVVLNVAARCSRGAVQGCDSREHCVMP